MILTGGYEEAGEGGRWCVRPGDVLLHGLFSAHCNRALPSGARVLNLALPETVRVSSAMRVPDADQLARVAERDSRAAAQALLEACTPGPPRIEDLPDLLAGALLSTGASVDDWSRRHGVCRQTAFRWFRDTYGVGPARYRVEARARRALQCIVGGSESLADVAAAAGFADQAHMCREVRVLTGCTPNAWRRQHSFKTAPD